MTTPAVARALGRISIAFANPNGRHKTMARTMLRITHAHVACRCRYGSLAMLAVDRRLDLDGALIVARQQLGNERVRHWNSKLIYGRSQLPMFRLDTLREVVLMLRWIRRHQPCRLPEILDALTTPVWHAIAAE